MNSKHIVDFKKKYGYNITQLTKIYANIITKRGVDLIFEKSVKAYGNGNEKAVSKREWAFSRLASVILGRNARTVDKDIWLKYKIKN